MSMAKEAWTILKLIDWTTHFFKEKGIHNPRLDSEILLANTLKLDRVGLYLNYDRPLTGNELSSFKGLVKRRAGREPLQYITGVQEFWSLEFKVGQGVLIPRPETEVLVEETLKEGKGDNNRPLVLDLCTGSGCIAISLAKELTGSTIYAIDNSGTALDIASRNAARHEVDNRITFLSGNLFSPLKGLNLEYSFDIIVSNPPYVKSKEIEGLEPEVKAFEPVSALNGGEDGLAVIRLIARDAPQYLRKGGILMMEIAFDQGKDVEYIIGERGAYTATTILKDYSGKDRVVKARTI
ncbi:MAG: peptide chain release factor N(5)-glutamine methyltransferase [Thermodesulfobacteriota bacterium]